MVVRSLEVGLLLRTSSTSTGLQHALRIALVPEKVVDPCRDWAPGMRRRLRLWSAWGGAGIGIAGQRRSRSPATVGTHSSRMRYTSAKIKTKWTISPDSDGSKARPVTPEMRRNSTDALRLLSGAQGALCDRDGR